MVLKALKLAPWSFVIYPLGFIASWVMTFLTWGLMCWIIATISMMTGSNQVKWLGWFYTHDASLDGGIEQGKDGYDHNAKGFKLWWQRVCWCCRNPAYGFVAGPLGFDAEGFKIIFESGTAYPPERHWTVVELKSGFRIFGYRNGRMWLGWKNQDIAGRIQLKSKPF